MKTERALGLARLLYSRQSAILRLSRTETPMSNAHMNAQSDSMTSSESLSSDELVRLVKRVFQPTGHDRGLAILVDLPEDACPDSANWRARRTMAVEWRIQLDAAADALGLEDIAIAWFPNVGKNNADLPPHAYVTRDELVRHHAKDVVGRLNDSFESLFQTHSLILAPTQFSATAPLKVAARSQAIRAATMSGFKTSMIPALKIDYVEVNRRVDLLKEIVDQATTAEVHFRVAEKTYELKIDLRYRTGHASGGLFPENGVAGNLPSGETYIVPYEGERDGDPSRTCGEMPVQFDEEVVVYRIAENRAIDVISTGPHSDAERERIHAEPAYANIAELGLGVLNDFGLDPVGVVLLDEKLGLHIAFGRSDHFGGQIGPSDFSAPEAVVHIDRVYLKTVQPRIEVVSVKIYSPTETREIMKHGVFCGLW